MKYKLILSGLALVLSQSVLAVPGKLSVDTCPSASAIKSAGVQQAIAKSSSWVAYSKHKLQTSESWLISVESRDEIQDEQEAVAKGNEIISHMSNLLMGPFEEQGYTICAYFDDAFQPAVVAITPDDFDLSQLFLQKFIR